MTLFTIGFAGSTAEAFFTALRGAGVRRVLDVRLRNTGQLSGFAKLPDLPYFLRELAGAEYVAVPSLVPTAEILDGYRDRQLTWEQYADAYRALLRSRRPEREVDAALLDGGCLLCSEHEPDRCHRRIAAEYLRDALAPSTPLEIMHL